MNESQMRHVVRTAERIFVDISVHAHVRKYWEAYGEQNAFLLVGHPGQDPTVSTKMHLWGESWRRTPDRKSIIKAPNMTVYNAEKSARASYDRLNRNIANGHLTSLESGKPGGAILHQLFSEECIISVGGMPEVAKETFALLLVESAEREDGLPMHLEVDEVPAYRDYFEARRARRNEIAERLGNTIWTEFMFSYATWFK